MSVLYKNSQWLVDSDGMDTLDRKYFIAADRLLEDPYDAWLFGKQVKTLSWPEHMAEKSWVNLDAFLRAFRKALEFHKGKYTGAALEEDLILAAALAYKKRAQSLVFELKLREKSNGERLKLFSLSELPDAEDDFFEASRP